MTKLNIDIDFSNKNIEIKENCSIEEFKWALIEIFKYSATEICKKEDIKYEEVFYQLVNDVINNKNVENTKEGYIYFNENHATDNIYIGFYGNQETIKYSIIKCIRIFSDMYLDYKSKEIDIDINDLRIKLYEEIIVFLKDQIKNTEMTQKKIIVFKPKLIFVFIIISICLIGVCVFVPSHLNLALVCFGTATSLFCVALKCFIKKIIMFISIVLLINIIGINIILNFIPIYNMIFISLATIILLITILNFLRSKE